MPTLSSLDGSQLPWVKLHLTGKSRLTNQISHLLISHFAIVTMFRQTFQARNKVNDRFARVRFAREEFLSRKRYILLDFEVIRQTCHRFVELFSVTFYFVWMKISRTPGPARCKSKARFCSLSSTPEAATYSSNLAFHLSQRCANVAGSPKQSKGEIQGKPLDVNPILVAKCSVYGSTRDSF